MEALIEDSQEAPHFGFSAPFEDVLCEGVDEARHLKYQMMQVDSIVAATLALGASAAMHLVVKWKEYPLLQRQKAGEL